MSFLRLVRWTSPIIEASGQVDIFDRSLDQADLWSDGPPCMWGLGLGWHFVRLWVRLTFGQTYPLAEKSCGWVCYYFHQVDLWSDEPPMIRLQVRLTFSQISGQADLWSDVPLMAETSCGQVCYYFSQVDLWSDIPPTIRLPGQVDI